MAYSQKEIDESINKICERIENGEALRNVLKDKGMPSSQTFFKWLLEDEKKSKQYAFACEMRAENMFEDMLNIADDSSQDEIITKDGNIMFNSEFAQRSRLRVDTRKWALSKLNPKKFGDSQKLTLEGGEKPITISFED